MRRWGRDGMMHVQAKGYRGLPTTTYDEKQEGLYPRASEGVQPYDILVLDFCPPEL
jgi:hypothetical protein